MSGPGGIVQTLGKTAMLDALCLIALLAFFGFLIYSTVIRGADRSPAPAAAPRPQLPPGPVGLFCSICRSPAGMVNHSEYMRISGAGAPVYCDSCTTVIGEYQRHQAVR